MSHYNVLGLGQPLIDNIIKIDTSHFEELGLTDKGGSQLIDQEDLELMLKKVADMRKDQERKETERAETIRRNRSRGQLSEEEDEEEEVKHEINYLKASLVPGGSCVNTIKGLAMLGERCACIGKIGRDEMGKYYKQSMQERQVFPLMTDSVSSRTGEVVCLVTPDGQRTMRAFLGASIEMNENDLVPQDFKGIKLFHVEGYSIYNQSLTVRGMQLAKQHNALVSFDLGSYELVRRFKPFLVDLLRNYVDVVFCNEEESKELVGGSAEDGVEFLGSICQVAIVMMGPRGCFVKSKNEKFRCPTTPVKAVDTTGAGDCFASGFLYGYLQGYSLEQCARLGALAGGAVVQCIGAEMTGQQWKQVKNAVNSEVFVKHKSSHNMVSGSSSLPSSVMKSSFMNRDDLFPSGKTKQKQQEEEEEEEASDFVQRPSPAIGIPSVKRK